MSARVNNCIIITGTATTIIIVDFTMTLFSYILLFKSLYFCPYPCNFQHQLYLSCFLIVLARLIVEHLASNYNSLNFAMMRRAQFPWRLIMVITCLIFTRMVLMVNCQNTKIIIKTVIYMSMCLCILYKIVRNLYCWNLVREVWFNQVKIYGVLTKHSVT